MTDLSPQALATCSTHYPRCGRCTIAGACHQRVAGGAEALQDWRRQVNAAAELCATGHDTHLCQTHAASGAPVQASLEL